MSTKDEGLTVSPNDSKPLVSSRSHRAIMACAKWLPYCIEIKFATKDQLEKLEAIWWQYHDSNGNLFRNGG